MRTLSQWQLRDAFARRLSAMYGREVPAYTTLLDVCEEINGEVAARRGAGAERLGSLRRVTAERHGAIRVGTPAELNQAARIFGALGMRPVGFYDLRDAARSAVPVISTAFRPIDPGELELNPFRVFTSMLTPADPRFFDGELREGLEAFLASRQLFGAELLELADIAEREGQLPEDQAERFLDQAVSAFELSPEPVDRAWYQRLEKVSAVAADIGGVRSTHINHLTPRVLDIDELYHRMSDRGIGMIDRIQGPPHWAGPDVLLRQTSFRALDEIRTMREPDGTVTAGALRVRFGEVEARGVALTREGRDRYDALAAAADLTTAASEKQDDTNEIARSLWQERFPASEQALREQNLAYFTYTARADHPDGYPPSTVDELVAQGWVTASPVVYEDFLPRSAAGIFQSNLSGEGTRDDDRAGVHYDQDWLAGAIERPILDPFALYQAQQHASLREVGRVLEIPVPADANRPLV